MPVVTISRKPSTFRTLSVHILFGTDWWTLYSTSLGCSPDLSTCTVAVGKAIAISPSRPKCADQGTCEHYSSECDTVIGTYLDLTSVGKQALKLYWTLAFTSFDIFDLLRPVVDDRVDALVIDSGLYWEYRIGIRKPDEFNPYSSSMMYKVVQYTYSSGNTMYWKTYRGIYDGLFQKLALAHCMGTNAVIGELFFTLSYEASPVAIIPLDYREYVKYQDLRKTFGYSYNGIDQPGWNAQDIINVLKEIFPDRVWMVFDDNTLTLYGYGITLEQVPQWLIDRLNPVAFKVLKEPWDLSLVEKFISELESRNYGRSQG